MNRCCPRRDPSRPVAVALEDEQGVKLAFTVGRMIELPRAAMAAAEIAEAAEFFSFGTNDLTQMTWGFSRDDVEALFFGTYLDEGIFGVSLRCGVRADGPLHPRFDLAADLFRGDRWRVRIHCARNLQRRRLYQQR